MITLHTMPGNQQLESFSPFRMKEEVYLKHPPLRYKIAPVDSKAAVAPHRGRA